MFPFQRMLKGEVACEVHQKKVNILANVLQKEALKIASVQI